ncbi:hypothetical protein PSTT_01845 [Puccinia striiformis]|uniref:Uncharacterized protein n=1 Tax=Puccinia striiformis TaxID=27350 RepID=A0A2S4W270_9BASI|nr:hypothetical protein PSTT_01845 [Puccinia striiformis]
MSESCYPSDSSDSELGNPTEVVTSKPSVAQEYLDQGDLIVQRFKSLRRKCHRKYDKRPHRVYDEVIPIDTLRLNRDLLHRLASTLLPLLGTQIARLSLLLNPISLLERTSSQFKLVLDHQLVLDQTLDQIISVFHTICPDRESAPVEPNDQHFQEFKSFRLHGLNSCMELPLFANLLDCFRGSYELIQHLDLSTKKYKHHNELAYTIKSCAGWLDFCQTSINDVIQWITGSEIDIIQGDWSEELGDIEETLEKFSIMIHSTISIHKHLIHPPREPSGDQSEEPHSEGAIRLAKLVIPIVKLSRLFFNTLPTGRMNGIKFPLYTEMKSSQLECLSESVNKISTDLKELLKILENADRPFEGWATSPHIIKKAQEIQTRFDSYLYLILLYIVPQIPPTDNGFSDQNDLRNCCTMARR